MFEHGGHHVDIQTVWFRTDKPWWMFWRRWQRILEVICSCGWIEWNEQESGVWDDRAAMDAWFEHLEEW